MPELSIGMPVIINEFDRPCTRLVAVITKIDRFNDIVTAKYLCVDTITDVCGALIHRVTPLSDFGVALIVKNNGTVCCEPVGESVAKYPYTDEHRLWQPEQDKDYPARPEVLKLVNPEKFSHKTKGDLIDEHLRQ